MSSTSSRPSSRTWYGNIPNRSAVGQIMPPRPPSHTGTADRGSFTDRHPNSGKDDWIRDSTSSATSSSARSLTYGSGGNSAMGQMVSNHQPSSVAGSSSSGNDWASRTARSNRSLTDGSPNSTNGGQIRDNTPSATSGSAPGSWGYGSRVNSAMGRIISNEPSQVSGKETSSSRLASSSSPRNDPAPSSYNPPHPQYMDASTAPFSDPTEGALDKIRNFTFQFN